MAKKPKDKIPANINTKAVLLPENQNLASVTGQLETAGDRDWFKVDLIAGRTYSFYLSFLNKGSTTEGDGNLILWSGDGLVGEQVNDNGGVNKNSILQFAPVSSGTYFLDVGSAAKAGSYGLFVISSVLSTAPDHLLTELPDTHTSVADERIVGGTGDDIITMGAADVALGEQGNDTITGNSQSNIISGGLGNDDIDGGGEFDFLYGDAGNDIVRGGAGDDQVFGGIGNDILEGNDGLDSLFGGAGKDRMSGGASSDLFEFNAISESRPGAARDVILDFTSDEFIDLFSIDAKTGIAGNQTFKFIGARPFHEKKGELHFLKKAGYLLVEGDVNGDGKADFQIQVHGVTTLTAGDFSL